GRAGHQVDRAGAVGHDGAPSHDVVPAARGAGRHRPRRALGARHAAVGLPEHGRRSHATAESPRGGRALRAPSARRRDDRDAARGADDVAVRTADLMRRVAHAASLSTLALVLVGAGPVPPPPSGMPPAPPPLPAAVAEPSVPLAERAAAIEAAAEEPDGKRVVLGHLSRKLGMSAEALRAQRAQSGLGWGDLLIANRLSLETHAPFDALVAEMRGGRGRARRGS